MLDEWRGLPWFAAEVPHMREEVVADRLAAAGVPVIAPLTAIEVRAHRRYKRSELRAHPALPGYLFLAVPSVDWWPTILDTKGLGRIVSVQQTPARIPAAQIRRFLARLVDVQPDPPGDPEAEFVAGQTLCVRGFEWRGRTVEFVRRCGPQAEVIGWMLGVERTLRVPVDRLIAA